MIPVPSEERQDWILRAVAAHPGETIGNYWRLYGGEALGATLLEFGDAFAWLAHEYHIVGQRKGKKTHYWVQTPGGEGV